MLAWQWDKVVTPYWTKQAKFAEDHGVKIAIEMHPGFVAYSPETMLKLRAIAGKSIGCNYDPSHMFWQGIDPIAAIRVLGDCIFHVHAKDTQIYDRNLPMTGVLDTKSYTDERNRAWIFRTCGYGHDAAVVEGIHQHAAHVRLRLRALHRARGQPDVARGRPLESGIVPECHRDQGETRRGLVGVEESAAGGLEKAKGKCQPAPPLYLSIYRSIFGYARARFVRRV